MSSKVKGFLRTVYLRGVITTSKKKRKLFFDEYSKRYAKRKNLAVIFYR
jgi:hypothetical protein